MANIQAMEAKLLRMEQNVERLYSRMQEAYSGKNEKYAHKCYDQLKKAQQDKTEFSNTLFTARQQEDYNQSLRKEREQRNHSQKQNNRGQHSGYSHSNDRPYSERPNTNGSNNPSGIDTSSIPTVISNACSNAQDRNWSQWQYLGYLTDSDFRNSHPNFRACFKSGYYVAKCQINPSNHFRDGYQWLFSLNTSLSGQVGGRNYDYPHYSVYYSENGGDATIGEHLSCSPGVRINFTTDNLGSIKNKGIEGIRANVIKQLNESKRANISDVQDYLC